MSACSTSNRKNGFKHIIFLYVQYRYRRKKFQGSKLSNRTPSHLILGKTRNIQLLGPIPTTGYLTLCLPMIYMNMVLDTTFISVS